MGRSCFIEQCRYVHPLENFILKRMREMRHNYVTIHLFDGVESSTQATHLSDVERFYRCHHYYLAIDAMTTKRMNMFEKNVYCISVITA